jgi:hypothetical protein
MSTEVVDRSRKGVSADDRNERAQAAVKVFRSMQFALSNYARAVTGNPRVRVEIDGGVPRTDGTTIYYRPPIELGDRTPHERYYCDKRDSVGLHICPACRVREEVLVNIYHEIAHIAFDTFAETTDSDRRTAIKEAVKEWGGEYAQRIEKRIRNAPQVQAGNYLGLAGLISPFLPFLFNSLEDARVDSAMFAARKGTRKMLEADTLNLLRNGVPDAQGELHILSESPLNTQVSLACYLYVTGYRGWKQMLHSKVVADMDDDQLLSHLDRVKTAESASDVYSLTFPVLARLRELGYLLQPEEEPQDEQPSDEPDPSPEESSGEDEADSDRTDSDDRGGDSGSPDSSEAEGGSREEEGGDGSEDSDASGEEEDESPESMEAGEGGDAGDQASGQGDGEEEADSSGGADPGEGGSGGDDSPADDELDSGAGDEGGEAEAGADSGSNSDSQGEPEEGVDDDSGSDGVSRSPDDPSDTGETGPADGADGSDEGDEPADGPDEPSDSTPSDGSDGGDQESASSDDTDSEAGMDSGDGSSGDADAGQGQGEGRSELDRDRGDEGDEAQGESGSESDGQDEGDASPEADSDSGERGHPEDSEGSGGGDDARREERPEREDSGPDGVLESGADQGLGGIEVELPPKGSSDDVAAALDHSHVEHKADEKPVAEASADERAILVAIVQGQYFETPSLGVSTVSEYDYPEGRAWDHSVFKGDEKLMTYVGVRAEMDIPESVLGPALLKTRRIFSDNKTASNERNLRSGRINQKVLGRRAWSGDERLFTKKRFPGKKDYAVLIGMDISSSNRGDNLALLKRSVMAQAELCQRVGVEFSIIAHSCTVDRSTQQFELQLHHVKDWRQPWDSATQKALSDLNAIGGNLDGHALEFMRNSMQQVTATDKIILYYTDGKMPAANKDEELEVLIRQIKLCARDRITLLGVGMQTDSPIRHGLDTVQVDSDEDLSAVVNHLGKRLARSAR